MKRLLKHMKLLALLLCLGGLFSADFVHATSVRDKGLEYVKFREIDRATFNEYRYRMTEKYFEIRDAFQVEREVDQSLLLDLANLAQEGYKYLPSDNLTNKNLYSDLDSHIKQLANNPRSESTLNKMVASLQNYVEDIDIERMRGDIEVSPQEGNAPLNVTLRANIIDDTGVEIPSYNYVWWFDTGSEKKIIARKKFVNYTFLEEGNYSIFLGVVSNHKNSLGNTDVLPYYGKADIRVKEKVASMIIKVNSSNLGSSDELKFDSDDARFGLLFDATSSTPNSGMKFTQTEWDFGNGEKRKYDGGPRVEKVSYPNNGRYPVKLRLSTNSGEMVERTFTVYINHPAASIQSSRSEGYIGDKFTFSSKSYRKGDDNVNYSWEIIDINNDKVIYTKNSNVFNYVFTEKGRYNVKLRILLSNGDEDTDTKIIYINSRVPTASFVSTIPFPHKPSYVYLDGSRSFDPDASDDGNLRFSWTIDGKRVRLADSDEKGSTGYFQFDSLGQHSVSLEITDPDNMSNIKTGNVEIRSLLDVDFSPNPPAVQRDGTVNFVAQSENAKFYEWNFGDGTKDYGSTKNINHIYEKSGSFPVTLTVTDSKNNTNKITRNVFVGKSESPVSVFTMTSNGSDNLDFDETACGGRGAFVASKLDALRLDGSKSIDIDGSTSGLTYSWKIGLNKYDSSAKPSYKFDELGCFPVKLTVVSNQNKMSDFTEQYVEIRNVLPTLSSLSINSGNEETDPIIFNVKAIGAKDPDGVIQSYLWYYYTDYDTEAQGFKTTSNPETSFVLPRITGTYYFGVVLKDNNEDKFYSEDIGKFFRTISSDNSNTPLIELKVDDNSVAIGDTVTFTAKVKNIIGKDLSSSVDYYWDFDGDGFFEKKGKSATEEYKYGKSGTFYPKLKVKYRGLSNVRNLTIDVNNKLTADFDYIAVGNKFVFIDKSQGKIDSATWDFGDGSKSDVIGNVVHDYEGTERVHTVKLTIEEGTKKETVEKEVVANMKNILKARKTGVNLFSSPILNEDLMRLNSEDEEAIIYPGEANGEDAEVAFYAVDYDIETDSDLNGGKDDDRDNKNTASYRNGTPLTIELNDNKTQKVRVYTLDENEKLIDTYDFVIEKSYIEEQVIDLDTIEFEGVSENEKQKIDKLKLLLSDLPNDKRLGAMKHVQKMQEEWFDARGKTDAIVEMQMYLSQIPDYNPNQVNELLESFLVEDTADKGERQVAHNALKNLVPPGINCDAGEEYENCNEMVLAKLEIIKNSNNLEENKKIGSEILDIIKNQDSNLISSEEKLRFKEVLKPFVYGGVTNIPLEERTDPVVNDPDTDKKSSLGILRWVLYITGGILGLILLGLIFFFVFYKLNNKDKNVEFQDFIIEKTSGKGKALSDDAVIESKGGTEDALASISFEEKSTKKETKADPIKESTPKDPLAENMFKPIDDPLKSDPSKKQKTGEVPSWLGNSEKTQNKKPDNSKAQLIDSQKDFSSTNAKADVSNSKTESVPDWLKGVKLDGGDKKKTEEKKGNDNIGEKNNTVVDKNSNRTDAKKSENNNIDRRQSNSATAHTPKKNADTKDQGDGSVPSWLKGSLDTDAQKKNETNSEKIGTVKKENNTAQKNEKNIKNQTKAPIKNKPVERNEAKKNDNKKGSNSTSQNVQQKNLKDDDIEKITKLDDGIPDWLKGSLDTPSKKTDTAKVEKNEQKIEGNNINKVEQNKVNEKKFEEKKQTIPQETKKTNPSSTKKAKPKIDTTVEKKLAVAPEKKVEQTPKAPPSRLKADAEIADGEDSNLGDGALWEDGMDIPDWLKGDDGKKPNA